MVNPHPGGAALSIASDMEIRRRGRTYTVDSSRLLKTGTARRELVYLIGSDTSSLPTWRTAEKVAQLCTMLVVLREGDQVKEVRAEQARLNREYGLAAVC